MARVSQQELRDRILQRADIKTADANTWVTLTELDQLINTAGARLHGLLVDAFEDHFVSRANFTLQTGKESYDLVADIGLVDANNNPLFYKLRELFLTTGSGPSLLRYRLQQFNTRDLGRMAPISTVYAAYIPYNLPTLSYRLMGNKIYFAPIPSSGGLTLEIWYIPQFVPFTVNASVQAAQAAFLDYSVIPGWDDFIVNDSVIDIRNKEESDVTAFMAVHNDFIKDIQRTSKNRNTAIAQTVTDVENDILLWRGF